jgi:CHRD domain-containing protein/PEP-CTERM motif-containing protein
MRRFAIIYGLTLFLFLLASPIYAAPVEFFATLTGANETPTPTGSPGTGLADVTIDSVAHTLHVHITFSGLVAGIIASHIHCCGLQTQSLMVATTTPTFLNFPLGVTSGTYDNTLDTTLASSFNPAFIGVGTVAGAEAALFAGIMAGQAYLNIHTTAFPGGEIRGPLLTPEPGTLLLLSAGLTGLAHRLWRKRRRA